VDGTPPDPSPERPGFYERRTSLGTKLDHWDGKVWRRIPYPNPIVYVWGVTCANQALPWRPLPPKPRRGFLGSTPSGEIDDH
jgi:hypothetical protein